LGIRDAGVSDEVWEQLERDRAEEQRREEAYKKLKEAQKSASDSARKRIIQQLVEAEGRRKMEAARKAKLMAMGSCPVGYQWIKQNGGYTCAGGSHYMSDKQVDGL
jgi:ferric-dicitrate binding protein FerR (iron transport regulator)